MMAMLVGEAWLIHSNIEAWWVFPWRNPHVGTQSLARCAINRYRRLLR